MNSANRDNTARISKLRDVSTNEAEAFDKGDGDDVVFIETESQTSGDSGTEVPGADAGQAAKKTRRAPGRIVFSLVALALLAGAGWWGHDYWTVGRFMVSTDDAYVRGDITTIAPKVSGYVARVNVSANQRVKAGDPLVTLDDGDYRIARDRAQSQLATQKLTLKRIDAQISGARAALAQARAKKTALEATTENARQAHDRASHLRQSDFASQASLDNATAALAQAKANLAGADAGIAAASANIDVLRAQRAEAESQLKTLQLALDKANRDLGFTVLKAPYDGVVGNIAVHKGDLVSSGQRLAALVPVGDLYVEANFKETQIAKLRPGETVDVHVDAYGADPIKGTVASLSPASGSVFSLLPPENATGNFTKVVQRVPVRIALPRSALESGRLRAGLSVVVDVDSRTAPASETASAAGGADGPVASVR